MQQADYDSLAPSFCEAIGVAGDCLKMAHGTIVNLLANGVDRSRVINAYTAFCEAIDVSCDVVWQGFDFAVENNPSLTREGHEHLLQSVGNFLTCWHHRLRDVDYNLQRFGVVAEVPRMVQ